MLETMEFSVREPARVRLTKKFYIALGESNDPYLCLHCMTCKHDIVI